MSVLIESIEVAGIKFLRKMIQLLRVFPVKSNRLLFCSFRGEGYSCNPKYISRYFHEKGDYEIIWAYDPKKVEPQRIFPAYVKLCKYHSLKYFYYLTTCFAAFDNCGFISVYSRREGQTLVNTWHGGGCYKNVEQGEKNTSRLLLIRKKMSMDNINLFLSSCKAFTRYEIGEQFLYDGEILNCGLPRNDIIFKQNAADKYYRKIREYYGIAPDAKIVLYAPTWRYSDEYDIYNIDVDNLLDCLHDKFGGEWYFIYRMHRFTQKDGAEKSEKVLSANDYPDVMQLLLASDVLISDYSSIIWDYSYTYRPCFLYTVDLDHYTENRGFVRDIYSWNFPLCKSNNELFECIRNYDEEKFHRSMEKHHKDFGSFETGTACKQVYNRIMKNCISEEV